MSEKQEKAMDQILDLLLDALNERQQTRGSNAAAPPIPEKIDEPPAENKAEESKPQPEKNPKSEYEIREPKQLAKNKTSKKTAAKAKKKSAPLVDAFKHVVNEVAVDAPETIEPEKEKTDYGLWDESAERLPTINMNKVFYRMAISLFLLIVVVNMPFNRFGTNLARAMPDERALIVRNGLVFKGPGDDIYVLEDNHKRWISSLAAFELHYFEWEMVHEVDQEFVDQFPDGKPIHVLIRCDAQPHIYLLEEGKKRWIENPREFEKAGFVWEEVKYVSSCYKLKNDYPDGIPIPADAGDPPTW